MWFHQIFGTDPELWHFDSWRSLKSCFVANNPKTFRYFAETGSSARVRGTPQRMVFKRCGKCLAFRWKLRWDILVGSLIIYRWIPCHFKPLKQWNCGSPFEIIWNYAVWKHKALLSSTVWLKGMKRQFVEAIRLLLSISLHPKIRKTREWIVNSWFWWVNSRQLAQQALKHFWKPTRVRRDSQPTTLHSQAVSVCVIANVSVFHCKRTWEL